MKWNALIVEIDQVALISLTLMITLANASSLTNEMSKVHGGCLTLVCDVGATQKYHNAIKTSIYKITVYHRGLFDLIPISLLK